MIQSQGKLFARQQTYTYQHSNSKPKRTQILWMTHSEKKKQAKGCNTLNPKETQQSSQKQATLQHQTNTYYNELNNKIAEQQSAHNSA